MIYFISDTHFSHSNIIKYCNRPFNNVDIMNEALINNWNSIVNKNDIVYHLGDFTIDYDNLGELVKKLNGKIYLIRGNHEGKSIKFYNEIGLKVLPSKTKLDEYNFILSHKPLDNNLIPDNYINIHGHIHNNILDNKFNSDNHYCVSIEKINYMPIALEVLLSRKAK